MRGITTIRNDHIENEINDLEFHLSSLATYVLKVVGNQGVSRNVHPILCHWLFHLLTSLATSVLPCYL